LSINSHYRHEIFHWLCSSHSFWFGIRYIIKKYVWVWHRYVTKRYLLINVCNPRSSSKTIGTRKTSSIYFFVCHPHELREPSTSPRRCSILCGDLIAPTTTCMEEKLGWGHAIGHFMHWIINLATSWLMIGISRVGFPLLVLHST